MNRQSENLSDIIAIEKPMYVYKWSNFTFKAEQYGYYIYVYSNEDLIEFIKSEDCIRNTEIFKEQLCNGIRRLITMDEKLVVNSTWKELLLNNKIYL